LAANFADDAHKKWVRDQCRQRNVWLCECAGELAGVMVMAVDEIFYLITAPAHRKSGRLLLKMRKRECGKNIMSRREAEQGKQIGRSCNYSKNSGSRRITTGSHNPAGLFMLRCRRAGLFAVARDLSKACRL
jgi:hypothetical protein